MLQLLKSRKTIGLLLLLLLLPLFGATFLSFSSEKSKDRYFELIQSLDIFATLFRTLNRQYVDEIQPLKLVGGAISAMLEQLDPYTVYVSEEEISRHMLKRAGAAGVGLQLASRREGIFVKGLRPGSVAAASAPLRLGDMVRAINSAPLVGRPLAEAEALLKGAAGEPVSLLMESPNGATYELKLPRKALKKRSVSHYQVLNSTNNSAIGYVKLTIFSSTAASELRHALLALKKAGAEAFIIDLRDNGGGLLQQAIAIVNFFVPKGREVVYARGRDPAINKTYYAQSEPLDVTSPVVILVNAASASASEIVAGVLQDYDRGIVLGENTYGKGLLQATVPLVYNVQLRLTTARYHTPSGRCIQAIHYSSSAQKATENAYKKEQQRLFYTKNKRPVRDRAGIAPDILVSAPSRHPFLRELAQKWLIFDYATTYYAQHPRPPDTGRDFMLSELDYRAFSKWLLKEPRAYEDAAHNVLNLLRDTLHRQANRFEKHFTAIEKELSQHLKRRLQSQKEPLKRLLSHEISRRYMRTNPINLQPKYDQDPYILKAQRLLADTSWYARTLLP